MARAATISETTAVIANCDGFVLLHRFEADSAQWRNVKLVRLGGRHREKSNWWLGWNGQRLASNHDADLLRKYEPEIYQWVISSLEVYPWPPR